MPLLLTTPPGVLAVEVGRLDSVRVPSGVGRLWSWAHIGVSGTIYYRLSDHEFLKKLQGSLFAEMEPAFLSTKN